MTSPFRRLQTRTVALSETNIDTDQIIPAKFLTVTDREGLGRHCFHALRFTGNGRKSEHYLNRVDMSTHQVLVAGDNFGCGSSREHAAWALASFGVQVVISTSFGDIFRSNALKNGLLTVQVEKSVLRRLLEGAGEAVTVDLEEEKLLFGNHSVRFETEPFARICLLNGTDPLGMLMDFLPVIEAFEAEAGPGS